MQWSIIRKEIIMKNRQLKNYKQTNNKFEELKEQFLEMAQLKSNFDIEKFTVKREGNFIAHNFHFLMRQYPLTLSELRRMYLDIEEKERQKKEYIELQKEKDYLEVKSDNGLTSKIYLDIEIERIKNGIDLLMISLKAKWEACIYFEECRLKIIELNGGKAPTNKQYQKEEPEYWKWFLQRKAITQFKQRLTGIHEGVWDNIENMEQLALIDNDFHVPMLQDDGFLNMNQLMSENEIRKGIPNRVEKLLQLTNKTESEK